MAELGSELALSKELSNNMLMLRRHEKDFLLRKNEKYVDKFNQHNRMSHVLPFSFSLQANKKGAR